MTVPVICLRSASRDHAGLSQGMTGIAERSLGGVPAFSDASLLLGNMSVCAIHGVAMIALANRKQNDPRYRVACILIRNFGIGFIY